MRRLVTPAVVAVLCACFYIPNLSARAQSPQDTPDPAQDVIERLLDQLRHGSSVVAQADTTPPPAPAEERPEPVESADPKKQPPEDPKKPALSNPVSGSRAGELNKILDDLTTRSESHDDGNARRALMLLEQAKSAEAKNKLADALRLAGAARRADPKNPEILNYISTLEKSTASLRDEMSNLSKAKAHLAAGLTRGQILMEKARYADAADLLDGVINASKLFPNPGDVSIYHRLAVKELERYQARIKSGAILPQEVEETPSESEEAVLVATGAAAPENVRRLISSVEKLTPQWYIEMKNRLAFPMSVNYMGTNAVVVFEDIGKKTGVEIRIDDPIARGRSHLNAHIDLRIADVPAETILDLVCMKAGLEYVLMERGVIITTPARALRYVQNLPESVLNNWAAARVLFPETAPELLASPPLPTPIPGQAAPGPSMLDQGVPAYLLSGAALVKDIQSLLKS